MASHPAATMVRAARSTDPASSAVMMLASGSIRSTASQPQVTADERLGECQEQVINIVALLRAHFEDVTETGGR